MKNARKQVSLRLKSAGTVKGATLLEVMISVFIMAFGIMALMLAQVKSVGSVREAEMQTRVAQAVQNLSEGMLANPDARNAASEVLGFTRYNKARTVIPAGTVCPNPTASAPSVRVCGAGTSTQMARCQIEAFESDLVCALPNATNIAYAITTASARTTIAVEWTERNGHETSDAFQFQYSAVVGN